MTSGRNHSLNQSAAYMQPERFVNYLAHRSNPDAIDYCLFVDIDGTLAPFTLNPTDSFITSATLEILQSLNNHGIKVAAVTGRSLAQAKQMLAPLDLPIAASHGLQIAMSSLNNNHQSGANDVISAVPVDNAALIEIKHAIRRACRSYPDFILEDKSHSAALHYRQNPTLAQTAYHIMSTIAAPYPNWTLRQGKYVWEVMPKGADKGSAILTLLQHFQTDKPIFSIFIGDDITDEVGFAAVQGGFKSQPSLKGSVTPSPSIKNHLIDRPSPSITGIGIKVGSASTCAHYYVNTIEEVVAVLNSFLVFCQQRRAGRSALIKERTAIQKSVRRMS